MSTRAASGTRTASPTWLRVSTAGRLWAVGCQTAAGEAAPPHWIGALQWSSPNSGPHYSCSLGNRRRRRNRRPLRLLARRLPSGASINKCARLTGWLGSPAALLLVARACPRRLPSRPNALALVFAAKQFSKRQQVFFKPLARSNIRVSQKSKATVDRQAAPACWSWWSRKLNENCTSEAKV